MKHHLPRIMIAAPASGSGKTTVTCAVLRAIIKNGSKPSSFKCGPDYIDPMFHTEVLGVDATNLDIFLTGENTCRYLLHKYSQKSDIAVIEGVMGYYDGLLTDTRYSSYHIAKITNTPVVLVLCCKGMSYTAAAIVKGMASFKDDSNIKGVILNNTSEKMYAVYKEIIEKETDIKVIGYMPNLPDCNFDSRHLGLITATETENLQQKLDKLADTAVRTIDIDMLRELANTAPLLEYENIIIGKKFNVNIAVAKDKAFCFYYKSALSLLEQLGASITYFSPIKDSKLPDCDGFILGGGYPELYLKELSENKAMLQDINAKIAMGIPHIAECGGFMYLFSKVKDSEESCYSLVGSIEGEAFMTKRLNRFGYVTLTANRDNLLCKKGESINAHEFHYSDSTANGSDFTAQKPYGNRQWSCIIADENRFIGYPHIHLWGNIGYAKRFLSKCQLRKEKQQ